MSELTPAVDGRKGPDARSVDGSFESICRLESMGAVLSDWTVRRATARAGVAPGRLQEWSFRRADRRSETTTHRTVLFYPKE